MKATGFRAVDSPTRTSYSSSPLTGLSRLGSLSLTLLTLLLAPLVERTPRPVPIGGVPRCIRFRVVFLSKSQKRGTGHFKTHLELHGGTPSHVPSPWSSTPVTPGGIRHLPAQWQPLGSDTPSHLPRHRGTSGTQGGALVTTLPTAPPVLPGLPTLSTDPKGTGEPVGTARKAVPRHLVSLQGWWEGVVPPRYSQGHKVTRCSGASPLLPPATQAPLPPKPTIGTRGRRL